MINFELVALSLALGIVGIIGLAVSAVRDYQNKAARREQSRQRRIARAQRLIIAGKRRDSAPRSEYEANLAMIEGALDRG